MVPRWLKYGFPAACFGLGSWQVYRWRRKEGLIREYLQAMQMPAQAIQTVSDIDMRCLKVYSLPTAGPFDNGAWIGPRTHEQQYQFQVVCPYKLADGQSILLNLGWAKARNEYPRGDNRFVVDKRSEHPSWFHSGLPVKNIEELAGALSTAPIMLKRIEDKCPYSNRHVEYVVTWYSLAVLSLLFGRLK